ncbi:MAG: beta-aspartyl-peptidase [Candidatus Aminicenantes bacterium]|nr:beta-aspartyl-peptidase [Candidatus Aminicenantes bacterium]
MILLKNCRVFSPTPQGTKDILIAGEKIAAIVDRSSTVDWQPIEIIDVKGNWVLPGLIDSHAHIAGAGGEGGPATRTGGLTIEQIFDGGITTVVGCLGTDGITRSVESVLMKAKGLKEQGISAYIYTGSYQIPTPTITGSVSKDIAMIEEVIGVGEVAIADHRSSFPNSEEFIKLSQEAKVGGMLGNKSGIVNVHLGDNSSPFALIYRAAEQDGIHFTRFLPTHCNRSRKVFAEAKVYGKKGPIDLTTGSYPFYPDIVVKPSTAFFELLDAGVPVENITFSSDAGGSLPQFDDKGNFVKIATGLPVSMFDELRDMLEKCRDDEKMIEAALRTVTANPARLLKLENKGTIKVGGDADLLVLKKNRREIDYLIARGVLLRDQDKN